MGRSAPCPGTEEPGNQARTVLAAAPPLCDTSAWALIPMTPCVGFQVLLFFPEAVRSAVSKGCPGLSSCTLSHLPLQMAKQASEKIVFPLVSDMSLALCPENLCAGEGLAYCHQPREEQSIPSGRGFGFSNPPSCMSSKAKETFKTWRERGSA